MAPKVPHPFKPGVMVSPQRVWQLKQQAMGKCVICGEPVVRGVRCRTHLLAARKYARLSKGCQPWKKGGKGRPPLSVKESK